MSVDDITVAWMSATAITYDAQMGRWLPDARGRLAAAALELYGERGFEQTTVAEIASRSGLTERTFFRHFADKREVLFAGSEILQQLLVEAVADAPGTASPIDAVATGLDAVAGAIGGNRDHSRRRQAIISANTDLRERELIKLAALGAAMTGALRERGVAEPTASLTAEAGIAVFRVAFERWVSEDDADGLAALMHRSLDDLRLALAAT
jgi:AcrR family transcriptional regulator